MRATEALPYIDEHATEIGVEAAATWEALLTVIERSFSAPASARGARLLGCTDAEPSGPRPPAVGSAFPGFHVEAARPPRELVLRGAHRFSEYALIFRLEEPAPGRSQLRAESRAAFPGLRGRAYRALVIGTRGHVLVTRRLLGAVKRRAERG